MVKEDIENVAKTAAAFFVDTEKYKNHPDSLPGYGPHPQYRYSELGAKIDSLAQAGITKPWAEWVKDARGEKPRRWYSLW